LGLMVLRTRHARAPRPAFLMVLLLILTACGVAEAQSLGRTYLPLASRDATPTPSAAADLVILSQAERQPGYHYLYFLIQNRGSTTWYQPRVWATYRLAGSAGAEGGTTYWGGQANLRMLRPGETTAARLEAQIAREEFTTYEVSLSASRAPDVEYLHDGLDAEVLGIHRSGTEVVAEVRLTNNTGEVLPQPWLDVSLLRRDGTIADAFPGFTPFPRTAPFDLTRVSPGQSAIGTIRFDNADGHIPDDVTVRAAGEGYR
jgi:hypothetical protein